MQRFPAWMVGVVYLPFGLYNGFIATALTLLLTQRGVSLGDAGSVLFIILLPSFLSFLITPLVDCGMPRRAWAMLLAIVCAACLAAAVFLLDDAARSPSARHIFTAVLTLGYLAAQMYGSSIGGMVPNLVDEGSLPAASTLLNIAYLGGTGVGGTIAVIAISRLSHGAASAVLMCEMVLPAACLFLVRGEDRVPRAFAETLQSFAGDIGGSVRARGVWLGFLIFITPSATFVAINYFGGMGADFAATGERTAWITGTGVAVLCSLGAILCGFLLKRFDTRWLVILPGALTAVATLGMVYGPHTATVFLAGVCFYALLAGVNYVAVSALAFELIGPNNPLSATLYAMLMAACNVAIEAVVLSDGRAASHGGTRALLLTDAAISATSGVLMLTFLTLLDRRRRLN